MRAITRFSIACLLALTGGQALTQGVHDERNRWDPRGWERLGEVTVQGGYDRDVVRVGRNEGAFTQLMLSVEGSDVDIYDIVVTFGNGQKFSPNTRFHFRGGASTGAIDLPGASRGIQTIELRSGNLPGGGRARVIVWGKPGALPPPPLPTPTPPPPTPPPRPPAWNPTGWERLGEQTVDGRNDRDVIRVGAREGAFTTLMLVVENGDLDLYDMVVTFANGERYSPPVRLRFREGTRTGAIDLPGAARVIESIEFRYGNIPGGGRARVEVWGKPGGFVPPPPQPPPPVWNPTGWERLGEQTVDGRNDRDVIRVGRREGAFTTLMLVVEGGDLDLYDMAVTFANGERYSPPVRLRFREGTRTGAIDLPGAARVIESIEFRYGNVPGGGRARVEVWGKPGGIVPPPPPPAWDPSDWVRLGRTVVNGRYDRDIIRVRGWRRYGQIVVAVKDSELEMFDMTISFRDGSRFSPDTRLVFGERSRTRVIDLPGGARAIRSIAFRYGNLGGRNREARVEIFGR